MQHIDIPNFLLPTKYSFVSIKSVVIDPKLTLIVVFQVQLSSHTSIESVSVTINSDSFQHFTIFVIELLHGNKALYKPCSKFEVNIIQQQNWNYIVQLLCQAQVKNLQNVIESNIIIKAYTLLDRAICIQVYVCVGVRLLIMPALVLSI